jgi:nucleoside-diphosphate-sugar epimerase
VERIAALMGSVVTPVFGAVPDRIEKPMPVANVDIATRLLGWAPAWSLQEGLTATIAHYTRMSGAAVT